MSPKTRLMLGTASAVFNILFLALIAILVSSGGKNRSILFSGTGTNGSAAACIVSLPPENAAAAFGPLEIALRKGDSCTVQFSLFSNGSQINIAFDPLYDREIISVSRSGYGLILRAVAPGQCVMQSVTSDGIKTFAVVTVTE